MIVVNMMEMSIVQKIFVSIVLHAQVPAVSTVCMSVSVVDRVFRFSHSDLHFDEG